MTDSARVNLEALKLVLQVAMADGTLADEETIRLLSMARRLGAPPEFQQHLAACAKGAESPVADLDLLKGHREKVLDLAREIALADGTVSESEADFLSVIENLLS